MGSFQITYDDFSGGQYMGNKSNNLPKNTWTGSNVVSTPDGKIMPSEPLELSRYQTGSSTSAAYIFDHWVVNSSSYVFSRWAGSTSDGKLTVQFLPNGTGAPYTATAYNLLDGSGSTVYPTGQVAYAQIPGRNYADFYLINGADGNIFRIGAQYNTGQVTLISSALYGIVISDTANLALYGYRLIMWGPSNRLYYSNTDMTTWSTAQYYEFNGFINNVVVRTNDLLVFTDEGVYSVVGVLGSSVTIQLIVPASNISEGMREAVAVNRNAFFVDDTGVQSSFDGKIYALTGSTVQVAHQILNSDTIEVSERQNAGHSIGHFGVVNNGRLAFQLVNGYFYVETTPGTWSRFYSSRNNYSDTLNHHQQRIGKPGPGSPDEYCVVASISTASPFSSSNHGIVLTRYIHNTPNIENINTSFGRTVKGTTPPTGTVQLSEYWHSKPFTVKEAFVQFYARTSYTPAITVGITPTGIVDLYSSYNGSASVEASEPLSVGTANSNNASITQNYRINDASKGFGIKPFLTFTNATIQRVILNCED